MMSKPNIAILGLVIMGVAAALIWNGHYFLAGALVLLSSASLDDSQERFDPEP
jgi:hypothetical protein